MVLGLHRTYDGKCTAQWARKGPPVTIIMSIENAEKLFEDAEKLCEKAERSEEYLTKRASENAQKLAFAGIAVIWIFRVGIPNAPVIRDGLLWPLLIFVLALVVDFAHYYGGGILWKRQHERIDRLILENKEPFPTEFKRLPKAFTFVVWHIKCALVIVGYVLLIWFLGAELCRTAAYRLEGTDGCHKSLDLGARYDGDVTPSNQADLEPGSNRLPQVHRGWARRRRATNRDYRGSWILGQSNNDGSSDRGVFALAIFGQNTPITTQDLGWARIVPT